MAAVVTSHSGISEDDLDRIFKALADRTRRSIVERLRQGPATIMALAGPFDMTLPAISKHLRVLETAGLIRRTKRGREHVCRLAPEAMADADRWLETYRVFWTDGLNKLAAELEDDGASE
jgi:DNA-binding transcriptional ArsR family regulator